ncbi:MAG: hypothetical protein Q8R05_00985 [Candidatus Omnitrophota bacterium]|nr:hypothetical protein [Candidatus Omnitrophota bacterium]
MLSRRRQLAVKIETQEGVAEAVSAIDAKLLPYDPKVGFDVEMFERNPARRSFSPLGKIPGKRPANISYRLELRGSGSINTLPEWAKVFAASGLEASALKLINIGAITGGPYLHAEFITGGTSGATGLVVIKTANGAPSMYFVPVVGTLQSGEQLTGVTSNATCMSSSAPASAGFVMHPVSDEIPSVTQALYEDGMRKLIKGSRGKAKLNFKSGDPVMADFEFQGVEAGVTDEPLLESIAHETTKPPVFLNALFSVDGFSARIEAMEIDLANTLVSRDDVNDARGILSFAITGRSYQGSFNPEMVKAIEHDFHSKMFSGSEMIVDFTVGSVAGDKFRFYIPRAQYVKVEDEERDGLQLAKCSFTLNGSLDPGDDELAILVL